MPEFAAGIEEPEAEEVAKSFSKTLKDKGIGDVKVKGRKIVIESEEKNLEIEKTVNKALNEVHDENPHLKKPVLKRRLRILNWLFKRDPAYYVYFTKKRRSPLAVLRGLKRKE